jgi:hypothetical protein
VKKLLLLYLESVKERFLLYLERVKERFLLCLESVKSSFFSPAHIRLGRVIHEIVGLCVDKLIGPPYGLVLLISVLPRVSASTRS